MAAVEQYLHGIEVIEVNDGIRPIQTVKSAVIGLIGTAPDADTDLFPINEPILLNGAKRKAALLGEAGTLKDALSDIFSIVGATVVVVRVTEGNNLNATMANMVGDPITKTGVWAFTKANEAIKVKPRLLCAPGFTGTRPTNGIVSFTINDGGSGYSSLPTVTVNGNGVGAQAKAVVVSGSIDSIEVKNPGMNYTNATVTITDATGSGAAASAVFGTVANPVAKSLEQVAHRLRAFAFVDGPNSSHENAVSYRGDFGSDRVMILDPYAMVYDRSLASYVARPPSHIAAAMQCLVDREKGFWDSFSNYNCPLIGGVSRPVSWDLEDPDTDSNYLNANEVTPIIRVDTASEGGFRFWGVRSCSSDPLWAFMNVRRTADMVHESLIQAFLWLVDRPFTPQTLEDAVRSVRAYLRILRNRGAILGGTAWLDPELNTPDQMMAGKLAISFDMEPPAPIERVSFYSHRNSAYYEVLLQDVIRELSI